MTTRGAKHLRELAAMVAQGHRAVMLLPHPARRRRALHPRADLDPAYAEAFRLATEAGVEALAFAAA